MTATATVTLTTVDGPMPTYQASPATAAKGGIVVIQEAFGVTTHIEAVCERLADAGWLAVAPALFHREATSVFAYDDLASVMPVMGKTSAAALTVDLDAAFAHLEAAGFAAAQSGVIGFCMGGTVSFHAGVQRPLGAAVTFYGGGVTEGRFGLPALADAAPNLQSPWLGAFGDLDKGIPVADVETLRSAARQAKVPTEIVRYADADHGFNCDDRPAVFHADAAADAWAKSLAWFDSHIASA